MSNETSHQIVLDDDARQTLVALADLLIPVSSRMPSASQAGVGGEWIDRALAARPDWADALVALLKRARGKEHRIILAELQTLDPASFTMLTELVAGAYFMNPAIRKLIGYPGQRAVPITPEEDMQELIQPVIQRGPIYRS
ncbi:MAG TPA: hypothetical protein VKR06_15810 [Ktedonosporobacter sp.]|nr:hypothetical protein [Ktedonosporobacter sp.]